MLERPANVDDAYDVSIVIPSIGRADLCLASVASVERFRRTSGLRIDLIVVEQGSAPAYPIPDGFDGRWLFSSRSGASHARNVGLDHAVAPTVMFLDDDAELQADAAVMLAELRARRAVMVCGRMLAPDGSLSRGRGDAADVRPWNAFHLFAEPAAMWDTLALRSVGGWDERFGPPSPLGAEEGAELLARLARATDRPMRFVAVDAICHPALGAAPPEKVRRYGVGNAGLLVLRPGRWTFGYVSVTVVRRLGGVVTAARRGDHAGLAHRLAWLRGWVAGPGVAWRRRHAPSRAAIAVELVSG